MRLFALLRGLREGIARHEGEDRIVVVVDVVRVRAVGLCGRLGATSAHGRARAAMIGDAAHDTDGVPALPARRWWERTARRSSRRVGDALGATHARAPAPTVNARVARTRAGAAAEKEAHVNMSGRCREDAPSGARDFQSARAADQATFRLVMDDARRASTGPTARSLVGGVVRTASCAPECVAPRENLDRVRDGRTRPPDRRDERIVRIHSCLSPVRCCSFASAGRSGGHTRARVRD